MNTIVGWDNAVNEVRTDMVFENRNKEYGAYELRKKYQSRLLRSFIITFSGIIIITVVPLLVKYFSEHAITAKPTVSDEITLEAPPEDETPPPPPAEPPPPVQKTIQFTPPVVVEDEKVEDPPPTQEEVEETKVATVTQEGENIVDLPPENPVVDPDEGKVFTIVEEMPSFPGGEEKMLEYIQKNVKYPALARENNITGRVYVTFVIDKDGKIKDARILRGIGGGCDEEALRVVKSMPDWKAGRQNGRSVQVQFNLPVNFQLK
jgi:protein TonB